MIISFQNKHIREICEYKKLANQSYGEDVAKKLHSRIADLMAAENVSELVVGSPSEVLFNEIIFFSVKIAENINLIFKSSHVDTPTKGEAIDWASVYRIKIIEIQNNNE